MLCVLLQNSYCVGVASSNLPPPHFNRMQIGKVVTTYLSSLLDEKDALYHLSFLLKLVYLLRKKKATGPIYLLLSKMPPQDLGSLLYWEYQNMLEVRAWLCSKPASHFFKKKK